jgi:hypothetical protein
MGTGSTRLSESFDNAVAIGVVNQADSLWRARHLATNRR